MHFDREALRGIYLALEDVDQYDVYRACVHLDFDPDDGHIADASLPQFVEIMVAKGHIMPFDIPNYVIAAEEYDDIMLAMEIMA
jgi:hypothetical protein